MSAELGSRRRQILGLMTSTECLTEATAIALLKKFEQLSCSEELDRLGAKSEKVPRAQCLGCGEFLSATRVEMRIERCSSCEDKPRRRRR
jgi:hypothetical protein